MRRQDGRTLQPALSPDGYHVAHCCDQRRANDDHCRRGTSRDNRRAKLQDRDLPEQLVQTRRQWRTPSLNVKSPHKTSAYMSAIAKTFTNGIALGTLLPFPET